MSRILLFHHAQGQTLGFFAFAEEFRPAGYIVYGFLELADADTLLR